MNISEKAAYLKGLMEGMEYDENSKEGKLFKGIIDLLEDLALTVLDIDDEQATMNDYIEELDADLGAVEEMVYEDCDCGCDCDCDCDDDCCDCDDDCETDFFEAECPHCGESVYIDESLEDDEIVCPSCDKKFVLEDEE